MIYPKRLKIGAGFSGVYNARKDKFLGAKEEEASFRAGLKALFIAKRAEMFPTLGTSRMSYEENLYVRAEVLWTLGWLKEEDYEDNIQECLMAYANVRHEEWETLHAL